MNGGQRLASARAFWADDEAIDDQIQAALLIAQQKKFRPKTVIGLDLDRKSKHLASLAIATRFDRRARTDPVSPVGSAAADGRASSTRSASSTRTV